MVLPLGTTVAAPSTGDDHPMPDEQLQHERKHDRVATAGVTAQGPTMREPDGAVPP